MSKSPRGHQPVAPFFAPSNEHPFPAVPASSAKVPQPLTKAAQSVARVRRSSKFIDGVVGGERVLIARATAESEKGVEIRVRVALAAAGVMVLKHTVGPCWECGAKPNKRQGLGVGCSDLICIVPPFGRFLGIEMKRPGGGRVSEEQVRWLAVIRRFGGITGVARSVEEAMALVDEARRAP